MEKIRDYVEKAFSGIPETERKAAVMQDITETIGDSARRWMDEGRTEEDAANKAIVEFGDLSEIKRDLEGQPPPCGTRKNKVNLWFSIVASAVIVAFLAFINLYYSSLIIWFVYPAFAIIWWPIAVFFFGGWRRDR